MKFFTETSFELLHAKIRLLLMVLARKTESFQPGTRHWYSAAVSVDFGSVTMAKGAPICNDNAVSFRHNFRQFAVARQQILRIRIVDA